jgi:hypothetical protein
MSARYAVQVDGPFPTQDRDGDEIPYWSVCLMDIDGEVSGKVYMCYAHSTARQLADRIARDRKLELVDDSTPE